MIGHDVDQLVGAAEGAVAVAVAEAEIQALVAVGGVGDDLELRRRGREGEAVGQRGVDDRVVEEDRDVVGKARPEPVDGQHAGW